MISKSIMINKYTFIKTAVFMMFMLLMMFVLSACGDGFRAGDGYEMAVEQPQNPETPAYMEDSDAGDYDGEGFIPEATPPPEEIQLERGEDGILIGSMVFNNPQMRVSNLPADSSARVRTGPSTNYDIVGSIGFRQIVEVSEVVNGWYRAVVLGDHGADAIQGFVRSDLLREYTEEDSLARMRVGSETFDEPLRLTVNRARVNVRTGPCDETYPRVRMYDNIGDEAYRALQLTRGQLVESTELVDGWFRVTISPGMFEGYIRSDLLDEYVEGRQYFAEPRIDYIDGLRSELVDVRTIIPDIVVNMVFATPDNFTGRTLYEREVVMLQRGTAERLARAAEQFAEDGFRIKIFDAYRPASVSGILFDIIRNPTYVAPAGRSTHNRGAAIDMTLVDANGNMLEMPSAMHTFDPTSHRTSTTMSDEARRNMDYMTNIMMQNGFTTIQSEWWHFNDVDRHSFPVLNLMYRDFTFFFVDN